jgi:hypothetical protein
LSETAHGASPVSAAQRPHASHWRTLGGERQLTVPTRRTPPLLLLLLSLAARTPLPLLLSVAGTTPPGKRQR